MAVIPVNNPSSIFPANAAITVWGAHAAGDTGAPINPSSGLSLSGVLQGSGTFGGATLTLEQSVNGTDWAPVTDINTGTVIALTAPTQVAPFSEACPFYRTKVTGGAPVGLTPSVYMMRG